MIFKGDIVDKKVMAFILVIIIIIAGIVISDRIGRSTREKEVRDLISYQIEILNSKDTEKFYDMLTNYSKAKIDMDYVTRFMSDEKARNSHRELVEIESVIVKGNVATVNAVVEYTTNGLYILDVYHDPRRYLILQSFDIETNDEIHIVANYGQYGIFEMTFTPSEETKLLSEKIHLHSIIMNLLFLAGYISSENKRVVDTTT